MSDYDPAFERLLEGIDYTVVDGKWVFTRAYLLRRGYCCECGCQNCPYGFVAPPNRTHESRQRDEND